MTIDHTTENTLRFPLDRRTLIVGRDPSCDVRLKGVGVSRFHARLHLDPKESFIEEMEDAPALWINGRMVRKAPFVSNDILIVGVNKFSVELTSTTLTLRRIDEPEEAPLTPDSNSSDVVTIGRDSSNSLHLCHPLISRFHAVATKIKDSGYCLEDLGSANGTFVNGKRIRRAVIEDGDIVHIGPYRFFCEQGKLHQARDFNRIQLDAFNVTVVKRRHVLLDDVSLSISPGEFVAILGPSGSGKTTLTHTLMGETHLNEGAIFFNGLPIKKFCNAFNSIIGFVTQENLLRPELTVQETFYEQSLLRLPRDSTIAEHQERIREITDLLGLSSIACCRIADISGGEVKRVHFGVELLSSPTIIFFDEPFAGLDPGLIQKFMMLFRTICDKGHTLLLTTHSLEQIDCCNRILFMNEGKLTFSGTPKELAARYGIASLSEVYEKERAVCKSIAPAIRPRRKKKPVLHYGLSAVSPRCLYTVKSISMPRQFMMLIVRYSKILLRDKKNLMLMLSQAPLIALMLMFVYTPRIDSFPVSFYFCLSISAIWMGGMNSIREIAREWPLIERELRIGLSPTIYCLSKVFVFGLCGMLQAVIFGLCIDIFFPEFVFSGSIALLLSTACVSGTLLGLCMSVLSKNVNMAISWLPIIFIPQIFFSGILVPFDEMSGVGRIFSYLTVSRYVFSMFKKIYFLEQPLWPMKEWNALFLLCIGLIILMIVWIKGRRFNFNTAI